MRTYKAKHTDRTVKAVQYDGSYGQRRGIAFHLVNLGYTVRHLGADLALVSKMHPEGRVSRSLKPGYWLVEREWTFKHDHDESRAKSVQFMHDNDFRKAYEVTHGEG